LCEPSGDLLQGRATLADLPSYRCSVPLGTRGGALTDWFACYPAVPGAILTDGAEFHGVVSRQQLLEFTIRPQGMALLREPMTRLRGYLERDWLVLPASTSIEQAARRAFARSPHLLGDAVVVRSPLEYRLVDATVLYRADWQVRGIETQVRYESMRLQAIQKDKMASLGKLVDGVAHQILDPVGFIWGNLSHLGTYSTQLMHLVDAYREWAIARSGGQVPAELEELELEMDLEFLRRDLPQVLGSVRSGANRLRAIVSSLQNFCHLDEVYPKPADLNGHLKSIVLLLQSGMAATVQFVGNYGALPPVPCYVGLLDRAFMAVLINAVEATLARAVWQEATGGLVKDEGALPTVMLTTAVTSASRLAQGSGGPVGDDLPWIEVVIADNGPGMGPDLRQKIRDSFQAGPRSGKESGLTTAYHIVVGKHGGRFELRDRPEGGAMVVMQLPLGHG
jgi:signal transduction histidine kinase